MKVTRGDHDEHDDLRDHRMPSDPALRVIALESLLVDKGLVDPEALDALVDAYEHQIGPHNGARVVARAWKDPGYRERLLADATAAIAELGFGGLQGEHVVAVENTSDVHNLVVGARMDASDPAGAEPLRSVRARQSSRRCARSEAGRPAARV